MTRITKFFSCRGSIKKQMGEFSTIVGSCDDPAVPGMGYCPEHLDMIQQARQSRPAFDIGAVVEEFVLRQQGKKPLKPPNSPEPAS